MFVCHVICFIQKSVLLLVPVNLLFLFQVVQYVITVFIGYGLTN